MPAFLHSTQSAKYDVDRSAAEPLFGRTDRTAIRRAARQSMTGPLWLLDVLDDAWYLGCTAFGFWDTGLNTTQRRQQFEAASGGIGLA
jgi:hypothetical protein